MEKRGVGERSIDYYTVLGVCRDCASADKWNPDRLAELEAEEANRKFQNILEAYQVLSDEGKRFLLDEDLFNSKNNHEELEISR